jgi:hypothetical protein
MTSAWPQLEDLIRELGEVSALPHADGDPALDQASMAVTKATTALQKAAVTRGRSAEAALTQALATVEEARAMLRHARIAISAAAARQRRERPAVAAAVAVAPAGESDGTCPACGCSFVVRYRAAAATPRVVFPVACPGADCDGVGEVEYPASAVEVTVELISAP